MSSQCYNVGMKCFVPDATHLWLPAEIIHCDKNAILVRIQEISKNSSNVVQRTIACDKAGQLPLQNQSECAGKGVDNMIHLHHLHEAAILQNIRQRFYRELPYTLTGDTCIALNPYQWISSLYSEETRSLYYDRQNISNLPPHLYTISMSAYTEMIENKRNQSILVSGESGAGKTETTKLIMENIASVQNDLTLNASKTDAPSTVSAILQVNPLLESFGNAQTVRNDNSSRFGKFTQLQFDSQCAYQIIGASCQTYLLEKSRVVNQEQGEQNFHIFYQLLYGNLSALERERLHLNQRKKKDVLRYLRDDVSFHPKKMEMELTKTKSALQVIGFDASEQHSLFEMLSGVLHLGQIEFVSQEQTNRQDGCSIPHNDNLVACSALLGLEVNDLVNALCYRTMRAGQEEYLVPLSTTQGEIGRDALAKAIYAKIFDLLVQKINNVLGAKCEANVCNIGVLDIFGFESFGQNSFEQLCINYANEKLQEQFTKDIFQTVQAEYASEGIEWCHITYRDNQHVLSAIENRSGLIALLTEEITRPNGNEESFVRKLTQQFKQNSLTKPLALSFPLRSYTQFTIHHYAGDVTYDAKGFLEKHRDALHEDLTDLMRSKSRQIFSPMIFSLNTPQNTNATVGKAKTRSAGVGTQFKHSLHALVQSIKSTNVKYIRCIKPNTIKSPIEFDASMVAQQLRCAGIIDAVRIARSGYSVKLTVSSFVQTYILLANRANTDVNYRDTCESIMQSTEFHCPTEYQIGKTKIFMQNGVLERLELVKRKRMTRFVICVQRYYRGFAVRLYRKRAIAATIKLQATIRSVQSRKKYVQKLCAALRFQLLWRRYTLRKRNVRRIETNSESMERNAALLGNRDLQSQLKHLEDANARLRQRLHQNPNQRFRTSHISEIIEDKKEMVEALEEEVDRLVNYVRGRPEYSPREVASLFRSIEEDGIDHRMRASVTRTISSETANESDQEFEDSDDESVLSFAGHSFYEHESVFHFSDSE